jgi:S1-C subfamily serine protease
MQRCWFLAVLCLSTSAILAGGDARENAPPVFNDQQIQQKLLQEAERLLTDPHAVKVADLRAQLPARAENLRAMLPSKQPLPLSDNYRRARQSVLILGGLYKCGKCAHWHVSAASGFVISTSGAAVTNYHVLASPNTELLVAMTAAGNVVPVTKVLAASEANDLAVLQIDANGLVPLPILADAPVGSRVCTVSHPDGRYYTLTEGIISRYALQPHKGKPPVPTMLVTAEFARGSSGAPILDESGNAVGVVASTFGIHYDLEKKVDETQMVLKQCVPSAKLLDLLAPDGR